MLSVTSWNLASLAPVNAFPLRGKVAIASHLLIVAETIPLGDLGFIAPIDPALIAPLPIFPFRSETAVSTDLLVMTRTVPGSAGYSVAILSFAHRPPFSLNDFIIVFHYINLAIRRMSCCPTILKANIVPTIMQASNYVIKRIYII